MNNQIQIITARQELIFSSISSGKVKKFPISSAKNGLGQIQGSFCTPKGRHSIYQKIGDGAPIGAIFKARQFTGEIYNHQSKKNIEKYTSKNLILTRILWLEGLEEGFNLAEGKNSIKENLADQVVDSKNRFIYIHGTNHENLLTNACSKGCILMGSNDLIWLFEHTKIGDKVLIE